VHIERGHRRLLGVKIKHRVVYPESSMADTVHHQIHLIFERRIVAVSTIRRERHVVQILQVGQRLAELLAEELIFLDRVALESDACERVASSQVIQLV
jgi:protein gp37